MKREIDLSEISDGKYYSSSGLVRLGCDDCSGCSDCCSGVGDTIVLDPYDAFLLMKGTGQTFDELLSGPVELNIKDGLILPNLTMRGEYETCTFLSEAGRCLIHPYRPGICRLFPLGRIYQEHGFSYFLQSYECKKTNRTKVKISKWLEIPELKRYEQFILDWHEFRERVSGEMQNINDMEQLKKIGIGLINRFYRMPYDLSDDFYRQFYERML